MLVGIVAYNVLDVISLDEPRALGILLTAYAFQGKSLEMSRGKWAAYAHLQDWAFS